MNRRWSVGALPLALALPLLSHLPAAPALLSGAAVVGPDPITVDTTTTLSLARASSTIVADAWRASSVPRFLLDTFWVSAVRAASINHVDLVLAVDPTLRTLGWPQGWTALVLVVMVLNTASGWYAAASLGAERAGRFAAALGLGASGAAAWLLSEGQLANAVLAPFAVGLAAWVRLWAGDRRAALPAAGAWVLAAWLYWLNAVLVGGMVFAWSVGALVQRRWPSGRGLLAAGVSLAVAALLLWPGARAVLAQLGDEGGITATGVSAGSLLHDSNAVAATIDAVPWTSLVSPRAGYVWAAGAGTLLAGVGAVGVREARPLLVVVGLSVALAVGPFPAAPPALGGHDLGLAAVLHPSARSAAALQLATTPRVENPVYAAFVALGPAARMRHPVRWGLPLATALALLAAVGADRLARRSPRAAWALLLGSAAYATVGPLRLEVTPVDPAWASAVPCAYQAPGAAACVEPVAVPSFAPLSTRPGRQGGGRAVKLGDKAPL